MSTATPEQVLESIVSAGSTPGNLESLVQLYESEAAFRNRAQGAWLMARPASAKP